MSKIVRKLLILPGWTRISVLFANESRLACPIELTICQSNLELIDTDEQIRLPTEGF